MSTYDLEEQERINALKDWWDKWGGIVNIVLVLLALSLAGFQGWQYYQRSQAAEAEALFKGVKKTADEVIVSKEVKKLSEAANTLAEKYPRTFPATEAQLLAARAAFDAGDFEAAATHLKWVVANGRDTHRNIARLRLAAVLLEAKKFDVSLAALDDIKDAAFAPAAADLRGDVLAAQGKNAEARAAYQQSIDAAEARSALKAITQAKLDALGGAVAKTPVSDDKKAVVGKGAAQ